MNPRPIGIFDSGVGGLTVVHELHRRLPHESLIYFGDTARVPYGNKSPETVRRYAREILEFLLARDVKMVVVACNTASAHALDELRSLAPVPVEGVLGPGARAAVSASRSGRIGVIGTAGTVASGAYERAIRALEPGATVIQRACPLFVPLVEEGWLDHQATELVAREYLEPLKREAIDTLVLGCTHYPLLKPLLAEVLGEGIRLIDSAEETAAAVAAELERTGAAAPREAAGSTHFVVSDAPSAFAKIGAAFLGDRVRDIELAVLEPARG
ncbi:MAG TPA: glutamate racemase [Gemmatimonadales bacterium]|nr:glutamate racemase [Gemmatimonadales bacterium]